VVGLGGPAETLAERVERLGKTVKLQSLMIRALSRRVAADRDVQRAQARVIARAARRAGLEFGGPDRAR